MAEIDCRPQVHACAIRVALLDADGTPTVGATNLYVSDALVSMSYTPVITAGDEIEDKNACGTVMVNYKAPDSFKRGDVAIELVTPDPYLSAWLGGGNTLAVAGPPATVGAAGPAIGALAGNGVSIEVWTKRIEAGDLDDDYPYAHWAYPKITNLRPGAHTHASGALHPTFVGEAYENANWGDGPNNDFDAASVKTWQWIPTTTIPAATCTRGAVLADV